MSTAVVPSSAASISKESSEAQVNASQPRSSTLGIANNQRPNEMQAIRATLEEIQKLLTPREDNKTRLNG